VDWLELYLSNQRPNKEAAALLRKLAKDYNKPELAEGLEGTWRSSFSRRNCCENSSAVNRGPDDPLFSTHASPFPNFSVMSPLMK